MYIRLFVILKYWLPLCPRYGYGNRLNKFLINKNFRFIKLSAYDSKYMYKKQLSKLCDISYIFITENVKSPFNT